MESTDTAEQFSLAYPRNVAAALVGFVAFLLLATATPAKAQGASIYYTFNAPGTLTDAGSLVQSTSPYLWLKSGGKLIIQNGIGETLQGSLSSSDPLYATYAKNATQTTDGGAHPQNDFALFMKAPAKDTVAQVYVNRVADNLSNFANRKGYIGEELLARYQNDNNYYYAGIRADGDVVIKKKVNGVYTTLAEKKLFPGTYSASDFDLIPLNEWIGMKLTVQDGVNGVPQLNFYTDVGKSGTWTLQLSVSDANGSTIDQAGLAGVETDYADARFDNFLVADQGAVVATSQTSSNQTTSQQSPTPAQQPSSNTSYDSLVLNDQPALFLDMGSPSSGTEKDLSGHGLNGTYKGGTASSATLPNGDKATDFNGTSEYLTVPSSASLSIPTTGELTWEGWVRADTLQFPTASGDGYVDWLGKCENYSPNCEWEARFYGANTAQGRPDRLSAYVFNPTAGLGSGSDWQPASRVLNANQWVYVVAEYDLNSTPSGCNTSYPGSINIWVDGVKQDAAAHFPTGCMSQFSVRPKAGNSPMTVGTLALDTFFKGAVGKVAVYDHLLSQTQIDAHYKAMTGKTPTGSCGQTCSLN